MAIVFKMRPVALGSEYALGRRNHAFAAGVKLKCHAQCTAEGLKYSLALVVRVFALEVVDVQGDQRVVGKALKELPSQIDVEATDVGPGERYVVKQPGTAGEINYHAGEGFIQRHVGVAVATHAGFIAHSGGEGLAQGDADILDGMVVVDVHVAVTMDVEVDQAVTGDLVQHVV